MVSFDNLLCEVGLNLPIFIFLLSLPAILLSSTTILSRVFTQFSIFVDLGVPFAELMSCIFPPENKNLIKNLNSLNLS